MAHLLETRKTNYSLPQPFYGDADFHQLDLDQIWHRNWLFAGPACAAPAATSRARGCMRRSRR